MKILIAADGSPYTRRVLDYLGSHPEFAEGHQEYVVLHVVAAVPPRAAASVERELLQGYYDDEAEKVFKPIRSFFKKQGLEVYVPDVAAFRQACSGVLDKFPDLFQPDRIHPLEEAQPRMLDNVWPELRKLLAAMKPARRARP